MRPALKDLMKEMQESMCRWCKKIAPETYANCNEEKKIIINQ
jgi:hypothetical protein